MVREFIENIPELDAKEGKGSSLPEIIKYLPIRLRRTKGFRDSPNPDSGRVKKAGGIAGRRTGASATFRYFGLLCFS